jgi:hypothetical protein
MAALNFPSSPSNGDEFGGYVWNATKGTWDSSTGFDFDLTDLANVDTNGVADGNALVYDEASSTWIPGEGGGGASYTVSESAPVDPSAGDVWFNSTNGRSYIYYTDVDSSQWVEVSGAEGATGTVATLGDIPDVTLTGAQDGNALVYDAILEAWVPGEGGGKFAVSDTAPAAPENGDTWFKSDTGKTYIYYEDYDNGQWVEIASNTTGYLDIGQLNDVSIVSPTTGQALTYDGSGWVNATPASTLGSLTDVDTAGVADGQALVYDSANSEWVPGSAAPSGVNILDSDTVDVDFSDNVPLETRPVAGDVVFTGSNYSAGATKKFYLEGDTVQRTLTFPAAWNFITDKPTAIGANKKNLLDLNSFGTSESTTVALWLGLSAWEPISATGGTESEIIISGVTYKIHTFTSSGFFNITGLGSVEDIEYLIVGGGGGGGNSAASGNEAGGGGAGGLLYGITTPSIANTQATVGSGGSSSTSGQDSSIFGLSAIGGGAGATSPGSGQTGGSGGGGSHNSTSGGSGTAGQGNNGGTPTGSSSGGGGGGAGFAGQGGNNASNIPANGGNGLQIAITGTEVYYAGGGAGYVPNVSSTGGLGGGASKASGAGVGLPGAANTGGGGSGGGGGTNPGGNGGSGIIILRYPITDPN